MPLICCGPRGPARNIGHPAFCAAPGALRAFCVLLQPFQISCAPLSVLRRFPSKMDASSLAAAALAVAMDESRDAAVRELLLERERAAMNAEDLRSYVAQRHFTASQLVPRAPALTWEAAFAQHHTDLLLAHDAMRDALRAVRQGDDVRAEGLLAAEVRSSSEK